MIPLYKHDCDTCIFLGTFANVDLYFCTQGMLGLDTLIARYSDKPSDYFSGIVFKDSDPNIHEAYKRAKTRGLLQVEEEK